jgi:hypothetical protein
MHSKILPTLNQVIIKCTVHYIVHLQCTFSICCMYESNWFWRFSVGMGIKEDESSTGHVWAAGFHHVMAHSHLGAFWNLWTVYLFNFPLFLGRGKLQILNEQIQGHNCTHILCTICNVHAYCRVYIKELVLCGWLKGFLGVYFFTTHFGCLHRLWNITPV